MAVGKDSLKRAVTKKKIDKEEEKAPDMVVEVSLKDISFRHAKACPTLVQSIKENGTLLPIAVVKDGDSLKVADGTKRLNALKELGVSVVKAVVIEGDAKKIKAELKKCGASSEARKEEIAEVCNDVKEEKFNLVKKLGDDDFPVYLL